MIRRSRIRMVTLLDRSENLELALAGLFVFLCLCVLAEFG